MTATARTLAALAQAAPTNVRRQQLLLRIAVFAFLVALCFYTSVALRPPPQEEALPLVWHSQQPTLLPFPPATSRLSDVASPYFPSAPLKQDDPDAKYVSPLSHSTTSKPPPPLPRPQTSLSQPTVMPAAPPPTPPSTARNMSRLAIALKTGVSVAAERVPIQLLTFLRGFENLAIIGEAPGISVGDQDVVDVYTGQYEAAVERNKTLAAASAAAAPTGKDKASVSAANKPVTHLLRRDDDEAAEKVTVDWSSTGWKLDAHKNLPGIRLLRERFPDANWYLMIDDDTYVFLDNLMDFVATRDPAVPLYTGNRQVFVGCDGVKRISDSPGFAHGGSGILMSRAAVDAIIPIQRLWRLESADRAAGRRAAPTAADVFSAFVVDRDPLLSAAYGSYAAGYALHRHNMEGGDYNSLPLSEVGLRSPGGASGGGAKAGPAACADRCAAEDRCLSWAVDKGRCWLKDYIPPWKENPADDAWAGYLPAKYKCRAGAPAR
ncbi:hypothetical protein HK405_003255, partial [Cladochytrium tenue]